MSRKYVELILVNPHVFIQIQTVSLGHPLSEKARHNQNHRALVRQDQIKMQLVVSEKPPHRRFFLLNDYVIAFLTDFKIFVLCCI